MPTSQEWYTLGTGGGIETFLKQLFEHAAEWNLRITVPCAGDREGKMGPVTFFPIMRSATKEWEFTRRLRRTLIRGDLRPSRGAVVLANAEQYAWAFRGMKVPIVLLSHVAPPEQLGLRHSRLFVRLFQVLIERNAVTHARRIVVVNQSVKDYYMSRYQFLHEDSFAVIPLGLDLRLLDQRDTGSPWERLSLPPSTSLVSFVGRLYPEKNLGLFIAACDLLKQRGEGCHAVVVGTGIENHIVEDALTTRPWLHWIPKLGKYAEVLDLVAASRVLAVTSRYETGPLVLLEAIALGTPVVSTDVGRARELVKGYLGRVVPGESSAFADAVQEVFSWKSEAVQEASRVARPQLDFCLTMGALTSVLREVSAEPSG